MGDDTTFSDAAGDIKEEFKRRISSPYAGSYLIAWCVVNYEFLLVVFSAGDYGEKVAFVRDLYLHLPWWYPFGAPAALALIPVIAIPLANLCTDAFSKVVDIARDHVLQWIETGRRLPDATLQALVNTHHLDAQSVRVQAKEAIRRHAEICFELFRLSPKGMAGWRDLPDLGLIPADLSRELSELIEKVGFPVVGVTILKDLQNLGVRTESQVLTNAATSGQKLRADARRVLGLLLGAQLITVVWREGPEPAYRLDTQGHLLLRVIAARCPHVFADN